MSGNVSDNMFDSHSLDVLFQSCLEIKYLNSDIRDFPQFLLQNAAMLSCNFT
jgi:hypothetical protein